MSNLDKFKRACSTHPSINSPEDFARAYHLSLSKFNDMAATIRAVDQHDNTSSEWLSKFTRVKVPKLWMPRSFVEHCESLAHLMEVRVESIYQAIWIEAMYLYSTTVEDTNGGADSNPKSPDPVDDYLRSSNAPPETIPSRIS